MYLSKLFTVGLATLAFSSTQVFAQIPCPVCPTPQPPTHKPGCTAESLDFDEKDKDGRQFYWGHGPNTSAVYRVCMKRVSAPVTVIYGEGRSKDGLQAGCFDFSPGSTLVIKATNPDSNGAIDGYICKLP